MHEGTHVYLEHRQAGTACGRINSTSVPPVKRIVSPVLNLIWRLRRENALACLNELVTDALALVPDCLAYMRQIKHPEVFRFCAIPQVRASSRYCRKFAVRYL